MEVRDLINTARQAHVIGSGACRLAIAKGLQRRQGELHRLRDGHDICEFILSLLRETKEGDEARAMSDVQMPEGAQ